MSDKDHITTALHIRTCEVMEETLERVTRERDTLRKQMDGVLSIVRYFAENHGTDLVVGKVQKLMACYRGVMNERDEARDERDALRRELEIEGEVVAARQREIDALHARLAAMATRDCTSAEMMALAEIIQREYHQNTSTVGTFWGPVARAAWRYVRDRLLAETAQGANAEPTVESGGAPRTPVPPAPTPPAADASEVEALARELRDTYYGQTNWLLPQQPREWWIHLARHVLRREAALQVKAILLQRERDEMRESVRQWIDEAARLRERAERAEAEVERLRDPERERLIADLVSVFDAPEISTIEVYTKALALEQHERVRRAKEKP